MAFYGRLFNLSIRPGWKRTGISLNLQVNTSLWVLSVKRKCLPLPCQAIGTYIRKCFRTVLYRKCGNFLNARTNGQHSFLIWLCGQRDDSFLIYLISVECGVLGRLFAFRLATTSYKMNGISLTLSLFGYLFREAGMTN